MRTKRVIKFEKVECEVCHKMFDPRGLGVHRRHHADHKRHDRVDSNEVSKRTLGEAYVDPAVAAAIDRANADGDTSWDVVMVPISREVIMKLVNEWMSKGAKQV